MSLSIYGALWVAVGCWMAAASEITRQSNKVVTVADMKEVRVRRSTLDTGLTAAEEQEVLLIHNTLRAGEGSSNMLNMKWSSYLATMGQEWAEACAWEHGQPTRDENTMPHNPLGQNLFLTTGSLNVTSAVISWWNEKSFYNYDSTSCQTGKVCGHYTQVVWAKSYDLGCGFYKCAPLSNPSGSDYTSASFLVCNYGPAGNYAGASPFLKGSPCTQCDSGVMTCYQDKLCRENCAADGVSCTCKADCKNCATVTADCKCTCKAGWTGADCSAVCENTNSKCGANPGWPKSWCPDVDVDKAFMAQCPLLCETCEAPNGEVCTTTTTTTSSVTCSSHVCYNGGTPTEAGGACACSCPSDWQGDTCTHKKSEARIGVILRIKALLAKWPNIWSRLKPLIVNAVNTWCYNHFEVCCPLAGTMKSGTPSSTKMLLEEALSVGTGYPVEYQKNDLDYLRSLIFAYAEDDNDLCVTGSNYVGSRKKRATDDDVLTREKRATDTIGLPQKALSSAVAEAEPDIVTALSDCADACGGATYDGYEEATVDGESSGNPIMASMAIVTLMVAISVYAQNM